MIEIDREFERVPYPPVCLRCAHFREEEMNCDAFRREIPIEIWNGINPHRFPVQGDGGILFEEVE